ncbi:hypothetical protein Tco_0639691 [Tanacetum coccineum]
MAGYKHNQLRHKSFDDIQKLFNKALKRVNTFVPMDTEKVEGSKAKAVGINTIPLATKQAPIVDYKITRDARKIYYHITRADGSTKVYMRFEDMLKMFDREDLEVLYRIVKDMFKSTKPIGDNIVLWGNLMTMFEPSAGDEMWREQGGYLIKSWKLIDSCREGKLQVDFECEMTFELLRNTDGNCTVYERQKQVLKTENPGKRIAFLENEHNKSFAKCLHKEVERELAISKRKYMSSASSAVTYTSVYNDSELERVFWGADEEISDGGAPRVIPLPVVASPVALSPGYVLDSDQEEDPEEDSEEEHADYPTNGGDGDDKLSDDDDDDDIDDDDEEPFEDEGDDEEEEEHLALADSSAIPVVDPIPSAGDTEAFETDESAVTPRSPQIRVPFAQTCLCRARKTIRLEPPMSPSMEARIVKYATAPTPPLPVASPPLPLPSPLTISPTDAGAPLGYRTAGIRMRAASPPLLLPSTSHRTDIPEAEIPPWKRACFATPAPGFEIGESSAAGAVRQPRPASEADT